MGSTHDEAELEALKAAAAQRIAAGQLELGLGLEPGDGGPLPIISSRMGHLQDALEYGYRVLRLANPDAIYADDDGYRALLEIEGGGAVQNNRLMKDVVETLLIPGVHHLALAVPHSIHGRSPYDFAINLISVLYAREVPQRHVRGILVVGY